LTQQNQVLTSERKRDREWMLSWQTEKQQYEAVFENMQQIIVGLVCIEIGVGQ
jgi:hypothetical protein